MSSKEVYTVSRAEWAGQRGLSPEVFALHVVDDAAAPDIAKGDVVFIDPEAAPTSGSFVLVRPTHDEGPPVIWRWLNEGRATYLVRRCRRMRFTPAQSVLGVVMEARRKFPALEMVRANAGRGVRTVCV